MGEGRRLDIYEYICREDRHVAAAAHRLPVSRTAFVVIKEPVVKLNIHIRSAFETLGTPTVSEQAFLTALRARGHSIGDSRLALDKGLLEGLLERLPDGTLRERAGSVADELRNAGPDDISAPANAGQAPRTAAATPPAENPRR
jgi:hypothetical protein